MCHSGHPSAVGAEDVVREPDKAGERSATGLDEDNTSICMDCHNWQYEVQGTKPAYAPQKDLEAHASPSHPQRETLRGYSMVEIDEAGEFMPGAECEDCHMPMTNKAENRISHGMKIMLPGDAEKWMTAAKYTAGQDSCTTCHPSQSRDDLQIWIDTAQGRRRCTRPKTPRRPSPRPRSARSSPGPTRSRPATSWSARPRGTTRSTRTTLSGGMHNPDYVVDGLWKAEAWPSPWAAASRPVAGGKGVVSGLIMNGDKSPAIDGKLILYKNGKATTQWAASDYKGGFAFPVKGKGKYAVIWQRASEKAHLAHTARRESSSKTRPTKARAGSGRAHDPEGRGGIIPPRPSPSLQAARPLPTRGSADAAIRASSTPHPVSSSRPLTDRRPSRARHANDGTSRGAPGSGSPCGWSGRSSWSSS